MRAICRTINGDSDFGGVFFIPEGKTPEQVIKEEMEKEYGPDAEYPDDYLLKWYTENTTGFFFIDPLFAATLKLDLPDSCGTDSAEYAIKDGWTQLCRSFEVPSSFTASEEQIERYKRRFDKTPKPSINAIDRLRRMENATINKALGKGWSPTMKSLYDNFIDYASGPLGGGTVEEARSLTEIADDEDAESQWERMLETEFLFSAAQHWLEHNA